MPVSREYVHRVLQKTRKKGAKLGRMCDLLNKYHNINGNCSAAEGFRHCGIDLTDCPVPSFQPLVEFQQRFLARTLLSFEAMEKGQLNIDGSLLEPRRITAHGSSNKHGAFLSTCVTHCEGKRDSSWDTIRIDGVSIRHAVLEWYINTSTNPESLEKFFTIENNTTVLKDANRTKVHPQQGNRVYVDCAL
eukprot:CAMPEP_0201518348 /NCGR_PEP_ID=MMETSP0161_2-20130828/9229_1 /ASSEMBLY_ACC=CAM_ASM_000251 /TAXON_ID=180227 /ORGANISM="Neoparamoeba aestuarina, Strain SoJaBio B1-5/56/2" /LENGTH=189 /DNA_ID=CAMNT_0047916111 /DNA_START=135 /DNA_END=701 /DNA_ORIENTATION=+